jgi:hypothetical protein
MEKRKKVAFLTKTPPKGDPRKGYRHYWLSVSVLAQLRHDLLDNYMSFIEDDSWSPHMIAHLDNGVKYSCYCSGFDKYIDVKKLTPKGKPDYRTKERRFATTLGVVHFLEKRSNGR